MENTPNPQGKGLVPILDNLSNARTRIAVPPKTVQQISNELFTSMFILESNFSFKPVIQQSYYLYQKNNDYKLSLISPNEWDHLKFGEYIGECKLHQDLTWSLQLGEKSSKDESFLKYIESKRKQFEVMLENADKITHVLPEFQESLPFYQRVFASALASSLKLSMFKSGIHNLSYSEARLLLPPTQQ